MKRINKIQILSVFVIACTLITVSSIECFSQKKAKVRMSVQYVKVMGNQSYLQIQTKAKGESGYHPVPKLNLTIYQVFGDSTALLGDIRTQVDGSAKFVLKELIVNPSDTSGLFEYKVTNEATDQYKAGKKKVDFYVVNLMAEIVTKDSINYVSAYVTESVSDIPINGVRLKVNIERLFRSLQVGKSSYKTDESGSILVVVEEGIPGINGILNFEVMIDDSNDYGTVKTTFEAPVGVPVVATDTFDQRTMWSPPSKTPYYMLIVPNIIIAGIWLTLIMLTFNLYIISKSKI